MSFNELLDKYAPPEPEGRSFDSLLDTYAPLPKAQPVEQAPQTSILDYPEEAIASFQRGAANTAITGAGGLLELGVESKTAPESLVSGGIRLLEKTQMGRKFAALGLDSELADKIDEAKNARRPLDSDVIDLIDQATKASQEKVEEAIPVTPGFEDSWTRKGFEGLGSAAVFLPAALGGGPAVAALGGGVAKGSTYRNVRELGGSKEDARLYSNVSALVGAGTEPMGAAMTTVNILKRTEKATKGWFAKEILKAMRNEGGTEIIQEVPDEVARQAYMADRTLFDSLATLAEVGVLGGTIGGFMGGVGATIKAVVDRGNAKLRESYEQRVEAGQSDPTPSQSEFEAVGDPGGSRKVRASKIEEIIANPTLTRNSVDVTDQLTSTGELPNAPTSKNQAVSVEETQTGRLSPETQGQAVQDEAQSQGRAEGEALLEAQQNVFPGNKTRYSETNPAPQPVEQIPVKPAGQAGGEPNWTWGEGSGPSVPAGETSTAEGPEVATSLKNAVVDQQRAARGLDPVPKPEPRTFKELNETAEALLAKNPNLGDEVMAELRTTGRAADDLQHVILSRVYHEADLKYEGILRGIIEANESGNAERSVMLESMRDEAAQRLTEIEEVSEPSGSEAGRALGIRRMGLTGEQFTLARIVMEQEAAQGRKATPDELQELKELHAKHQKLQEELDALKEKAAAQEAEQAVKTVETAVKKERSTRSAKAKAEVDAVWAEVLPKFKGKLFSNPLDPELVAAGLKLAKAYIKLGVSNVADFATAIKEKIGATKYEAHQDIWEEAWRVAVVENKPVVGRRNLKKSAGLSRFAHELAKHFVETGVKNRDALIDAVHGELSAVLPGITRRQTMDAISGYGQYKLLSKEEVSAELRDLKGQMQQVGKLEDMAAGIAPRSTGIERRTPSDEERRLIAQVNEAKKKGGYKVTDPEKQLKTSLAAIETRLKNQIADLEAQIVKRERFVKTKTVPPTNDKIEALRAKADALREQLDAIAPKPELTDAQRLAHYKDVLTRREAELQDRLSHGDIEPKKRRDLTLDKEAEEKRFAVEKLKHEILKRREDARLARRSKKQKIWEGAKESLNTSRAILTSFDFSAVGRQGGILVAAHPRMARDAMADMFASLKESGFSRVTNELANRPNAGLYRRAKLALTDPNGKLSAQEEAYMSRWAKNLPGVKHSEQAYVAFLNRIRADVFDSLIATLGRGGTVTDAEAKIIANYVNVATGRGDLGKAAAGANALATVFFSPRYVLSRFQYLTGQPLRKGTISGEGSARVRVLLAKEYARSLTGLGVFYATMGAALTALIGPPGDDKKWNIELDPRSSDFGKIRIGQTRIDPMAGLQQATVLLSRIVSGKTKTLKGKTVPIRGEKVPFGTGDTSDVIARFLRTKLSPAIGSVIDIASGKDVVGQSVTPQGEAIEAVTPLSFREIYETMKEQGVPAGTALGILNLFGVAISTYEDRKKK